MPHYLPTKYPNIFGCNIYTEQISEYICTPEVAQIHVQNIFERNLIKIFEYLYSSMPVMSEYHKMDMNKYWNILGCHIMYRTNIQIYLDATYLPKEYPTILVLRK